MNGHINYMGGCYSVHITYMYTITFTCMVYMFIHIFEAKILETLVTVVTS